MLDIKPGQMFFRARNGVTANHDAYPVLEMGAPPSDKAKAGRFNEDGEPVLYMATTRAIALAEVRPARGEICSLAVLETQRSVKLALLLPVLAKFGLLDLASRHDGFIWEQLCEHLAHQPSQRERDLHYRTCRLIASVFKEHGAEGLVYRTSFYSDLWGDYTQPDTDVGVANIVFFEPDLAKVIESKRYELKWPKPEACLSESYIRRRE